MNSISQTPQKSARMYEHLALEQGRRADDVSGIRSILDQSYGPHPTHRLDVHAPTRDQGTTTSLPVLLFIHGGGFTQGCKEWNAFMAPVLAAIPVILVSIHYRLIPAVAWPLPLEDCRLALEWTYRHIGDFGGDPQRLFVGGHSAGAALAALLALEKGEAGVDKPKIAGVLSLSGSFNRLAITGTPGSDNHLPQGAMPVDSEAPLAMGLDQVESCPWLFIWGDREAQRHRVAHSSYVMMGRLLERGFPVQHLVSTDSDHFDVHLAFSDLSNAITRRVTSWLREHAHLPGEQFSAADGLIGMWRARRYQIGDVTYDLRGALALSSSHLVSAISLASDKEGKRRINANAGPYSVKDGCIEMTQTIQLHYDDDRPCETLLTEDLPEAILYKIDDDTLTLTFPSGNRMFLVRSD